MSVPMTVLAQVVVLASGLGVIRLRVRGGLERNTWYLALTVAWTALQTAGWGAELYARGWWG